jgi:hypothetical protein
VRGQNYQTVYTYSPGDGFAPAPNTNQGLPKYTPVEQSVVYKDFNGTTLQTVTKAWQDPFLLTCELETLDNGSISGTWYSYGSGGQMTDKKEYDYGLISSTSACVTGASPPSGVTPTRETAITYQSFASTPIFPSTPSIFDRPSSLVTYGLGTRAAETDEAYDQFGTATVSGLPSGTHDETNYASSSTAPRGNLTTVTKQCFQDVQSCTNSVTTYTYDETGQAVSLKDPCGNLPAPT